MTTRALVLVVLFACSEGAPPEPVASRAASAPAVESPLAPHAPAAGEADTPDEKHDEGDEEPARGAAPDVPSGAEALLLGVTAHGVERTRCREDAECVPVSVTCGGQSAEHRDDVDAVRRAYARRASVASCGVAAWNPPEELHGWCGPNDRCQLDVVVFPRFRRCALGDACVRIDDPCASASLTVREDLAEDARAAVQAPRRSRRCRERMRRIERRRAVADTRPPPRCQRGFCW